MESKSAPKRNRTSNEQLSRMADFMMECPDLATGKFNKLHGKFENDKKWGELSTMLNSLGGAVKTVDQWHTVWRDLKSRTSLKIRDRKRRQALTGNRPINEEPITELERRVISLIGKEYIEGHATVLENVPMEEEFQLRLESEDSNSTILPNLKFEVCETPASSARRTPRRCVKRKRMEDDSDTQSKFLDIAKKQADALMMLAEANSASVEIAKAQADATKTQADALKMLAETSAAAIETNKSLVAVMKTVGEGLMHIADAINKLCN